MSPSPEDATMIGTIKIRCPVCFGTGKVSAEFGSGVKTNEYVEDGKKTCPACDGTGMQEISYVMELPLNPLPNPNNPWVPIPNYVPWVPIPNYVPYPNPNPPYYQQQQNPCEQCSWTQEMRAKIARGETYVGDSPCSWCPHGPHVTCKTGDDSRNGGPVFR